MAEIEYKLNKYVLGIIPYNEHFISTYETSTMELCFHDFCSHPFSETDNYAHFSLFYILHTTTSITVSVKKRLKHCECLAGSVCRCAVLFPSFFSLFVGLNQEKSCLGFRAVYRLLINTVRVRWASFAWRHAKSLASRWTGPPRLHLWNPVSSYLEANVTVL